jgi:hypothetical protein
MDKTERTLVGKKSKHLRGCIYLLRNLVNGKGYVGKDQTGDPENHRWKSHIKDALSGKSKYPLHRAIRKFGPERFSAETIWCGLIEKLNVKEIYYIAKLHTYVRDPEGRGYNLTVGGDGAVGYAHTKRTRQQMSKSLLLHWALPASRRRHLKAIQSRESRAALSTAQKRRFAKMTDEDRAEYKAACSRVQKRCYKNPARHSAACKGQRHRFNDSVKRDANAKAHRTKKYKAKQAELSVAKWEDPKYRKKWMKSAYSPEGRRVRSQAAKKWHKDPEKHARQQAAVQSPKAKKLQHESMVAWYADPDNHAEHLKAHRTKAFRAKKRRDTKQFWKMMTAEERSAYWRSIHPHGTKAK